MMKVIPLWFFYLLMSLAIPFYVIFNHEGYISNYHYFRRRHGFRPLESFLHVFACHWMFGTVIMDRFASYSGKKFKVDVPQMPMYEELCAGKSGFLQLGSHIGNDELAGYELRPPKKMSALVFSGEGEALTENRERILGGNNVRLVNISGDMSHLVILNNALADGEIVNIHGDRVFGSNRTVCCEILGADAELPLGPFLLASMRNIPAVSVFVMKAGLRKYRVRLYRLDKGLEDLGVREKAVAMAKAYAGAVTEVLKVYPDQWFNFYEFWKND
jgi:predicted LPLAT superfamily acyltransferase